MNKILALLREYDVIKMAYVQGPPLPPKFLYLNLNLYLYPYLFLIQI